MKHIKYRFHTSVANKKHKIYQSRLRKFASEETSDMNSNFFPEQPEVDNSQVVNITLENTFHGLAEEGRKVLQTIEDYKFKLDQTTNMLNGNEQAQNKVEQKKKILDSASSQLYGIVFDLENFDLTPVTYEDEQLSLTAPAFTRDMSDGPGPADEAEADEEESNDESDEDMEELEEEPLDEEIEESDEEEEKEESDEDEESESALEKALKELDEE